MSTGLGSLRPASLIVLCAASLVWPVSASATTVKLEPAEAPPGTVVTVLGQICLYQGGDTLLFSDRFVPQLPDGITDDFTPVAEADVAPVDGEGTDYGIETSVQRFTVPDMPAGDYFVYLSCSDASACCLPLEPTFRVMAAPDTATELRPRAETDVPGLILVLAFILGLGMTTVWMHSSRSWTRRPS